MGCLEEEIGDAVRVRVACGVGQNTYEYEYSIQPRAIVILRCECCYKPQICRLTLLLYSPLELERIIYYIGFIYRRIWPYTKQAHSLAGRFCKTYVYGQDRS